MAIWTDLLDDVLPEINGTPPQPLVVHQIKLTVIDWYQRTKCAHKMSAAFDLVGGQVERTLPSSILGTTEQLVELRELYYLGKRLEGRTSAQIASDWPDWKTKVGSPVYLVQERPAAFWCVPSPSATETNALRAEYAYAPKTTAVAFDDWVMDQYRESLGHGVKARMFSMNGRPWSNPDLAGPMLVLYNAAVASAQVTAMSGAGKLETKPYYR